MRFSYFLPLLLLFLDLAQPGESHGEDPAKPAAPVSAPSQPAQPSLPSASPPPAPVLATPAAVPSGAGNTQFQTLNSAESDYVLTAGDSIEMSVFREPELTTRSTIARDGTVQLPLIEEVKLAGLTVREGRNLVRKLYAEKYLVQPQVYLNVLQYAERKFTIMGQVGRPGSYDLQGGQKLDLLEAIGMAGGFTRIADRGRVMVKRKVDGKDIAIKVNAKKMATADGERFEIQPGDVITVGESWY